MAGEPEGRGRKLTCLATCVKALFPSKPPVDSGGGASSAVRGGVEATALMKGALLAEDGELVLPPPLALHPASTARKKHGQSDPKIHSQNFASPPDRRNRI